MILVLGNPDYADITVKPIFDEAFPLFRVGN